ncbi:LysM peptidoglycan-binding domain-containing protein [Agromyces protaetiae]|uniref:LysM peptidoglycan-binding domain-containing protein n=1 Tax=Agromyces protaetiae TaxID=2509455 RepID=A0A4P6FEE7_9MICO|nr:LysM peptidoglycan-binding domain-containing protein [Agromyces protaetiae]QAY74304.1 LysM peptidoglycan-binding domain-containing protein [Agromyces protaetiae]
MGEAIAFDGFAGLAPRTLPVVASVPRTRLRLTRRGRIVFTSLAALPLVIWAMVAVLGSGAAAAGSATAGVGTTAFEVVTVGAGDTLWELAERIAPTEDPRETIAQIVRLNGLDDAVVQPGQQLSIPVAP